MEVVLLTRISLWWREGAGVGSEAALLTNMAANDVSAISLAFGTYKCGMDVIVG
jgi:hypothetical protein